MFSILTHIIPLSPIGFSQCNTAYTAWHAVPEDLRPMSLWGPWKWRWQPLKLEDSTCALSQNCGLFTSLHGLKASSDIAPGMFSLAVPKGDLGAHVSCWVLYKEQMASGDEEVKEWGLLLKGQARKAEREPSEVTCPLQACLTYSQSLPLGPSKLCLAQWIHLRESEEANPTHTPMDSHIYHIMFIWSCEWVCLHPAMWFGHMVTNSDNHSCSCYTWPHSCYTCIQSILFWLCKWLHAHS